MSKIGVLLVNIGTPDHCDNASVYRYLKEFLNDKRVIDLPAFIRWPLVNLCIVPFRYKKSAHAYRQIMTGKDSPLLTYSNQFKDALQAALGSDYQVELGMRYGNPPMAHALKKLNHLEEIIIFPLFPQYSSAATGSAIEESLRLIKQQWNIPTLRIINQFYNSPHFIDAYATHIQSQLIDKKVDLLLFSYHGLPERHLTKSACLAACDHAHACPSVSVENSNSFCYRAQCYETSHLIAKNLSLTPKEYAVSFQSRLGKTPWIKPYTDLLLPKLIEQGVKHIAMAFPSFVADCLETLEEADIRARAQWQSLGGETFTFISCLNDNPLWIKSAASIIKRE